MSWRSVFISQPARLSLHNNQLLIKQDDAYSVPLEDIAVIVVDSREVVITAPLLSACAKYGVSLITCDESFMPCGQFLSFSQHSRFLKMLQLQIGLPENFKAAIWQKIIQRKIEHQAFVLEAIGNNNGANHLKEIANSITQGDKENLEARAAHFYFPAIFGNSFSRKNENKINIRLNYAYAIIRAAVSRQIVAYGFLPALGLWHKSELNAFNLSDDLMEVFRPIVDLEIYTQLISGCLKDEFETMDKAKIVQILNYAIIFNQKKHAILSAIEQMIKSFSKAVVEQKIQYFQLPQMTIAKEIEYE